MPRSRVGATQRSDSEETRRAILRAAHDLFMASGYRAVTTRMVAEASGVKQPLIYYHFTDKEALYLEVQREVAVACKTALERIAARQSESIPERLRHMAHVLRGSRQQNMGMFLHEIRYELGEDVRQAMKELFVSHILTPIVSMFEEGMRVGELRSPQEGGVSPHLAAHLLLSAISMLAEMPQEEKSGKQGMANGSHDAIDTVVEVLIYGMATHSRESSPCNK